MANVSLRSWVSPRPDSFLGRLAARRVRHPDEFDCAVRVLAGVVPGESGRWRYRRTAADPLVLADGTVTVNHGAKTRLRVRLTGPPVDGTPRLRPFHMVWPAVEVTSGARIEIAADRGEAHRLSAPSDRGRTCS